MGDTKVQIHWGILEVVYLYRNVFGGVVILLCDPMVYGLISISLCSGESCDGGGCGGVNGSGGSIGGEGGSGGRIGGGCCGGGICRVGVIYLLGISTKPFVNSRI